MFSKKKKKPLISPPSNFEHRVHTGFDKREGKFVGLPLQWASLVGNNQVINKQFCSNNIKYINYNTYNILTDLL